MYTAIRMSASRLTDNARLSLDVRSRLDDPQGDVQAFATQACAHIAIDVGRKRVYTRNMSPCYCFLLRTATRKIGSVYDDALGPVGINIAQYSLLRLIERRQPVSFTELGRVAELDRSTVGRNVRVLKRMGLVETGRGEDDQREAVVTLAVAGTQVLEEAAPLWDQCQREIETRLGSANVKALREILRAL